MKQLFLPLLLLTTLTSCSENKGRIGGAFSGTRRTDVADVSSNGVYVKAQTIEMVENLRLPVNGQRDVTCSFFQDVTNPSSFTLYGLSYNDSLYFRAVTGHLERVSSSQTTVARLSPNSDFVFTDSLYQANENPSREALFARLTDDRLIIGLKRFRNADRPENQIGSTVYENISLTSFRLFNSALTESCR